MKNLFKIISIVLITTIFSCSKDDSPPPVMPKVETVYVGGVLEDANGKNIPTIWTNGVAQSLSVSAGNEGAVKSIFVDGNDVYAVGNEYSDILQSSSRAILWKNGIKTTLSQVDGSTAKSIFVHDGKYYIVGGVNGFATLWYNNTAVAIGNANSYAYSLSIKNNKIYILGNEFTTSTGSYKTVLWKNEVSLTYPISFTKTTIENAASVNDVFYDGTNLYSAGYLFSNVTTAKLWKNNLPSELYGDYSIMNSVFVNGQDVYATGRTGTSISINKATLWKNNIQTVLSQNDSTAEDVFTTSNNVYVAGYEINAIAKACIWKNGEIKNLSENSSIATSVFVTEK